MSAMSDPAVPVPGTPARKVISTGSVELDNGEGLNRYDVPDGGELHIHDGEHVGLWTVHYFDDDMQAELRPVGGAR